MNSQTLGILVGGLLPALCYGIAGLFSKTSTDAGMPVGSHLVFIGLAVSSVGGIFNQVFPGKVPSAMAIVSSSTLGAIWGLGTGCVALGLIFYQAPMAKLTPLYNMNTLIGVILALILFAEWKSVNVGILLAGTFLICVGGILVARA
ncbi:hypothetical protein IQ241_23495 [Romeria aff. gracilis LEGE 07310]|uniref:Uncharacterized protein n=1 Tax=Vasconcelosia minhoensis LEGE 07310 TaxID=915328 RepID=A0A8J7ABX5_9CYAN|nr:hypothetical protein [Romeria gracilis]MBE9080215.1 hypothetical protein [Romeria aff. gracilis LEGE 07310]